MFQFCKKSTFLIFFCFFLSSVNIVWAGEEEKSVDNTVENVTSFSLPIQLWSNVNIQDLYEKLKDADLNFDMLQKGILGLQRMLKIHPSTQTDIITLIDFQLPSYQERLYVIDLRRKKIIVKTHVAHGRASGELYASDFSNVIGSNKSSLGFYLTAETYQGKHGYSMRLDGMEYGINDNARKRAIILHSADYVSESVIKSTGRLGRSLGCPSVSADVFEKVIRITKEKSCLFIYHPSEDYLSKSRYLETDPTHVVNELISFYSNR